MPQRHAARGCAIRFTGEGKIKLSHWLGPNFCQHRDGKLGPAGCPTPSPGLGAEAMKRGVDRQLRANLRGKSTEGRRLTGSGFFFEAFFRVDGNTRSGAAATS